MTSGRPRNFGPQLKAASTVHNSNFGDCQCIFQFGKYINNFEDIRVRNFISRSWRGLELPLGRNLQYVDSDDFPSLDAVGALPHFCLASFLASGFLFAREFSIFLSARPQLRQVPTSLSH
jgi:hypothetical protein